MSKLRILLVDDHAVLRGGLKLLINNQADMEVVGEAGAAREVLPLAQQVRPDIVVLDLTLPDGGGLPQIEPLSRLPHAPRVVVLSMHDDPAYVRSALAAGATGYLVKTIGEQDLLAALRTISHGRVFIDLDDEARTASVFQPPVSRLPAGQAPPVSKLSDRESEVLRLLGRGLTNQAIAEQMDLSPKTVATYRARIADKLGLKTTADFVKYARDLRPQ